MESMSIHSICVFAGSADHLNQTYLSGAAELGRHLAQNQIRIIYGGGKTGLMGALADSRWQQVGRSSALFRAPSSNLNSSMIN